MKKKLIVAAAAAGAVAAAVPAMALENEFHGMMKVFGYQSNWLNDYAASAPSLSKQAKSGFHAEQRARLQYIAKANDNLKLVTHFEMDSRFGGQRVNTVSAVPGDATTGPNGYKGSYNGNDGGQLDADSVILETKHVYLDFNCPITGTNFKVGMQPWADAYKSVFLLADMTGAYATKKVIDPLTVSMGWFRYKDNDAWLATGTAAATSATQAPGQLTTDLIVLDGKYAVSKDIVAGLSYYNIQNDVTPVASPTAELLHMIGVNASVKVGPATIDPFFAYQFGDVTSTRKLKAWMGGTTAKVGLGSIGNVNAAVLYLSGEQNASDANGDSAFRNVQASTSYFNPANMWILVRNGQQVNTSTSVLGNDLTVGGRGLFGMFAGYEGKRDKLFYNANLGYAQAAVSKTDAENKTIGTELNAQVGYQLYDNLSVSVAGAYAWLGEGLKSRTGHRMNFGANDATNPYLTNVQLSYTF